MDFCPRLDFSLTVFVLSLYLIGEALCPESEGSCTSDDGTSCKETEGLGQLSSSFVSELNDTFILGKQPQRQTSSVEYYSSAVYISVKTTVSYHESRLAVLLLTWLQTVRPEQVMPCVSSQLFHLMSTPQFVQRVLNPHLPRGCALPHWMSRSFIL